MRVPLFKQTTYKKIGRQFRINSTAVLVLTVFLTATVTSFSTLNVNTWNMRIGKKTVLDYSKNKMGDIATINSKKLKQTDTLFAQRYLCGITANNSTTTLTIKNSQNQTIKEVINKSNKGMFTAQIPMKDILSSSNFKTGSTIDIFFSIEINQEKYNETVLLGKLLIK